MIMIRVTVFERQKMSLKYSKQRQAIWDFIEHRTDHPTADTVYSNVRKNMPNISLGTVYRNLVLLKDTGRLKALDVGDGVVHFDPCITPHDHFVCRCCGRIIDLPDTGTQEAVLGVQAATGGRVDERRSYYYGLCGSCVENRGLMN